MNKGNNFKIVGRTFYVSDKYALYLFSRYIIKKNHELYLKIQENYKIHAGIYAFTKYYNDGIDKKFSFKKYISSYADYYIHGTVYLDYIYMLNIFTRIQWAENTHEGISFWRNKNKIFNNVLNDRFKLKNI